MKILFIIFSSVIAAADIKTGAVPRIAFALAFLVFFVLDLLQAGIHSPVAALAGALLGLAVFLTAFFLSGRKLGLADVWYSALIGLVLGPWRWYAAIGIACITGIIYIFAAKKHRIPFIPFMALGSIVASIIQVWQR